MNIYSFIHSFTDRMWCRLAVWYLGQLWQLILHDGSMYHCQRCYALSNPVYPAMAFTAWQGNRSGTQSRRTGRTQTHAVV